MVTPTRNDDRLLTFKELAERWSVSRSQIYRLVQLGLPTYRLGGARRVRISEAEAWLQERRDA